GRRRDHHPGAVQFPLSRRRAQRCDQGRLPIGWRAAGNYQPRRPVWARTAAVGNTRTERVVMGESAVLAAIAFVVVCGGAFFLVAAGERRRASMRRRLDAFNAVATEGEPLDDVISLRRQQIERRFAFLSSEMLTQLDAVLAATGHSVNPLHLVATAGLAFSVVAAFSIWIMGL